MADSTESVITYLPQMVTDTTAGNPMIIVTRPTEEMTVSADGALNMLDFYNEELIENGDLVGEMFNSMDANLLVITALNVLVTFGIYFALKNKDSL